MNFIKIKKSDGNDIWINLDRIESMEKDDRGGTIMAFYGGRFFYSITSVEDILGLNDEVILHKEVLNENDPSTDYDALWKTLVSEFNADKMLRTDVSMWSPRDVFEKAYWSYKITVEQLTAAQKYFGEYRWNKTPDLA